MRKRFEIFGTGLIMAAMLAGCGNSNNNDSFSSATSSIVSESVIKEATTIDKDFTLDNICFQIAGNTYTIGKNTLGEMIDNGCSVREDVGTIKAGESAEYTVVLNDTWTISITVKNSKDADASAKDCIIVGINAPIYQTEADDLILFTFKKDMSVSDMISSLGGADEIKEDSSDEDYKSMIYIYKVQNEDINYELAFEFTGDELSNFEVNTTGESSEDDAETTDVSAKSPSEENPIDSSVSSSNELY